MSGKQNDGGPAFPVVFPYNVLGADFVPGMSLRDWFAGQAMSPMLVQAYGNTPEHLAKAAYAIADALIAERSLGLLEEPLTQDEKRGEVKASVTL